MLNQTRDLESAAKTQNASEKKKQRSMLTHENRILKAPPLPSNSASSPIPTSEPFHSHILTEATPELLVRILFLKSLRCPHLPFSSSLVSRDWDGEKDFLRDIHIDRNGGAESSVKFSNFFLSTSSQSSSESDLRRLELEIAKIQADAAKIEAECRLIELQKSVDSRIWSHVIMSCLPFSH